MAFYTTANFSQLCLMNHAKNYCSTSNDSSGMQRLVGWLVDAQGQVVQGRVAFSRIAEQEHSHFHVFRVKSIDKQKRRHSVSNSSTIYIGPTHT